MGDELESSTSQWINLEEIQYTSDEVILFVGKNLLSYDHINCSISSIILENLHISGNGTGRGSSSDSLTVPMPYEKRPQKSIHVVLDPKNGPRVVNHLSKIEAFSSVSISSSSSRDPYLLHSKYANQSWVSSRGSLLGGLGFDNTKYSIQTKVSHKYSLKHAPRRCL